MAMMPERNEGLCAGGPLDGQRVLSRFEQVDVPVANGGGFDVGSYHFHPIIELWVWRGPWRPTSVQ